MLPNCVCLYYAIVCVCMLPNCVCLCYTIVCVCVLPNCVCFCYAIGPKVIDPGLRFNRPTDPHRLSRHRQIGPCALQLWTLRIAIAWTAVDMQVAAILHNMHSVHPWNAIWYNMYTLEMQYGAMYTIWYNIHTLELQYGTICTPLKCNAMASQHKSNLMDAAAKIESV